MANGNWTLDDVPWSRLEPANVQSDILAVIKAAALVEVNALDYAAYLCAVFSDDPEFQALSRQWAEEEVQHGAALGRWAALVDPSFDFSAANARFRAGTRLPSGADGLSVRGTRCGELVARCVVEAGTSSFYTAVGDATAEPVLRFLCRRIAADEFRHYKLFHTHLRRYLDREGLGRARRTLVALGRMVESQDDELACAYHVANASGEPYDRQRAAGAYERRAFGLYRREHVRRMIAMTAKACGFSPGAWWVGAVEGIGWWLIRRRVIRLAKSA